MTIKSILARQIFDSRGNPTVEVDLTTEIGLFRSSVPSGGASIGKYEALELRNNDQNYNGKSVYNAIQNVNKRIGPELCKLNLNEQYQNEIDNCMIQLDGTPNKSNFGANAILGVSLAVCCAGARKLGIPLYKHIANLAGVKKFILPVPAFNIINGGSHAGNNLPIQEFMILPTGAKSFTEAMKMGTEVYHNLSNIISKKYGINNISVGDEGGYTPNLQSCKDALNLLQNAIAKAGYTGKINIGVDVAASEFNPFDQDHWKAWSYLTEKTNIQIAADHLTATNPSRIIKAIEKKAANSLLLKVNQIGTLTEAINAHLLAKNNNWSTMVSHRSGETEDTFIADLVVGLSNGQIKSGAPCRSERLAKYNQLLRIEERLGSDAKYAGNQFRNPDTG